MTFQQVKERAIGVCATSRKRIADVFERKHTIAGGAALISDCADAVRCEFVERGFAARKFSFVEDNTQGCLLVIAKHEMQLKLQALLGQSLAVWIRFKSNGVDAQIEIGSGKWIDKLFSGTVAWMVFAPMMIIPCFGAWKQYALIKYADEVVSEWLEKNKNRIGAIDV